MQTPWLLVQTLSSFDSVCFLVSLTPLTPIILPPHLLRISWAQPNVWLWVSASVSISCLMKSLWWQFSPITLNGLLSCFLRQGLSLMESSRRPEQPSCVHLPACGQHVLPCPFFLMWVLGIQNWFLMLAIARTSLTERVPNPNVLNLI